MTCAGCRWSSAKPCCGACSRTPDALRYADHVEARGEELFERVKQMGLEGLIAKKADSTLPRRPLEPVAEAGRRWYRRLRGVRLLARQGARGGFGALHVAAYDDDQRLVYCGRAGSGFTARQLEELKADLDALVRSSPAAVGPLPDGKGHVWVEPRLVAEVRYKTWTTDGLLRHPVFSRMRDDKRPEECTLASLPGVRPTVAAASLDSPAASPSSQRRVSSTRSAAGAGAPS